MDQIIGVTQLQKRFRTIFDEVTHNRTIYILTRRGRPEAALVPYDQYQKFIQSDEAGILKRFDEVLALMAVANAQYSEEEVMVDLEDSVSRAE